MKHNLKIAIIGSGYMGKRHIALFKNMAQTVILCSADEENGKALAAEHECKFYTDYIDMFEKEHPDCVSVCLPTHLHHQAVMKAFDYGIHVFCEKPFASNQEQAIEMVAKAKEKNLKLMVGHVVRFIREYEYLRRCIADQRFGKLLSLELFRHTVVPTWSVGNWLADISRSGGALADFHIHDTDMIINLLGAPKSVCTTGSLVSCHTTYRYDDDVAVSASGSWRPAKKFPFIAGFDASFEKATLKYSNQTGLNLYTMDDASNPLEAEILPEFFASGNSLENELKYFLHCIVNNTEPALCHPDDSLTTMIVNGKEAESLKAQKELVI